MHNNNLGLNRISGLKFVRISGIQQFILPAIRYSADYQLQYPFFVVEYPIKYPVSGLLLRPDIRYHDIRPIPTAISIISYKVSIFREWQIDIKR